MGYVKSQRIADEKPDGQLGSDCQERLVRLLTWLTGRKMSNTKKDYKQNEMVCLRKYPAAIWEYAPTGDFYSLTIKVVAAPNALHRGLQRLAFGVRYRPLPNAIGEARAASVAPPHQKGN
jgi:hypothetical protein